MMVKREPSIVEQLASKYIATAMTGPAVDLRSEVERGVVAILGELQQAAQEEDHSPGSRLDVHVVQDWLRWLITKHEQQEKKDA